MSSERSLKRNLDEMQKLFALSIKLIRETEQPEKLTEALLSEYVNRLNAASDGGIPDATALEKQAEASEEGRTLLAFAELAEAVRSISERHEKLKFRNTELDTHIEAQKKANEELRSLNTHYLNMLAFVSHELRSPLVSILGFAELLDDGYLGELNVEQQNCAQIIMRVSRTLLDMISNYLDMTRIENGELEIAWQHINLDQDVMSPILEQLAGQLESRGMRITGVEAITEQGLTAYGDRDLLRVVFMNLFSNAIKYGRGDTDIGLEIQQQEDYLQVAIRNLGQGVPDTQLDEIFKKFSKSLNNDPELPRGTGLGLFNTKVIVEAHGGEIWADSRQDEWFLVNVRLPRHATQRPVAAASAEKPAAPIQATRK